MTKMFCEATVIGDVDDYEVIEMDAMFWKMFQLKAMCLEKIITEMID